MECGLLLPWLLLNQRCLFRQVCLVEEVVRILNRDEFATFCQVILFLLLRHLLDRLALQIVPVDLRLLNHLNSARLRLLNHRLRFRLFGKLFLRRVRFLEQLDFGDFGFLLLFLYYDSGLIFFWLHQVSLDVLRSGVFALFLFGLACWLSFRWHLGL